MSEKAVTRYLAARGVVFAVIGARAMGMRGVVRVEPSFRHDVELHLSELPDDARELWQRFA